MKKIIGLACAAVLMGAGFAAGDEVTWVGDTDANLNTGLNWTPGAFIAGDSMLFGVAGTSGTALNNDLAADINVAGLTFTADSSAYTFSGAGITLGGNIGFSGNPASAITQTINLAMILSGTRVVTTTANGNITLGGVISGTGFGLTKEGAGTLTLSAANTFTGVLTLNAGTLRAAIDNNAALGAGTLALNGGTLYLASNSTRAYGRNTTLNGDTTIVVDHLTAQDAARTHSLGTLTVNGDVRLRIERGDLVADGVNRNGQINFGVTTLQGNLVVSMKARSYVQFGALSEDGGSYSLTLEAGSGGTSGVLLNGVGSWTGGTVVNSQTLRAAVPYSLGAEGGLTTINAGTLDLRHADSAFGRHITFAGTGTLQLNNSANTTWNMGTLLHTGGALTIVAQRTSDGANIEHVLDKALVLNGNLTLQPNARTGVDKGYVTLRFLGAITDNTGAAELRKTGGGVLLLETAASYGGDTRISNGILRLGAANVLPSGATTGNLVMDPTTGLTATLDLNGFTQTLNGISNSGAGSSVIDNSAAGAAALTVGANDASSAFSGVIQNSGAGNLSLTKTGAGTIDLSGANTYAGGTTISGGTLSFLTKAARSASGDVTVDPGATIGLGVHASDAAYWSAADLDTLWNDAFGLIAILDANSKIGVDTSAGDFTYATPQTDYTLVKLGANTLTLTGDSNFSGGTEIRGGTLMLGNGGTAGAVGSGNVVNDATLAVNRSDDITLAGNISGSGALTQLGAGALILSGANTYTGVTTINAGTLRYGANNVTPGDVVVNANAAGVTALLDLNGYNGTIGALTFGGTGATATSIHQVTTGTGTLTLGGNVTFDATGNPTTSASIAGNLNLGAATRIFNIGDSTGAAVDLAVGAVVSGDAGVGLTKTGAGTLELSGANTFTGPVTLNAGTLRVTTSAAALGADPATLVLNGGTLVLVNDASLNFGRNTTLSGNTTIVADSISTATGKTYTFGTLDVVDDVTLNILRGATITGTGNGRVDFGATTLGGNLTLTRNERGLIAFGDITEVGGPRSLTVAAGAGGNSLVLLTGTGGWTGGTTLSSGKIQANVANSLGAVGTLTTVTGGTLDLRHANAAVDRDVVFTGSGTLDLRANNNTTGTLFNIGTLSQTAGTLTITAQRTGDSTTGAIQILNEDIELNGNLTLNPLKHTAGGVVTLRFQGAITHASGTGELRKNGGGILILETPAQYGGNTRISNGTLRMGVANALPTGAGTGNLVMDPGTGLTATLDLNGFGHTVNGMSSSGVGTSVIDNTTATAVTLTVGDNNGGGVFGGNIQNTGGGALSLDKIGTGAISLSGQNAYTGGTSINGGTLSFVNRNALPSSGAVTVGGDAAVALGLHETDDLLYWTVGEFNQLWADGELGDITLNAASRVGIDTTGGNFTYTEAQSTRGLIKLGNNTLFLTGNNTYAGGTDILAGTLSIGDGGATGALGTGNVLNNANLTINRNNAHEIANNISGSGSLTHAGTGVTTLSGENTYTGVTTVNGGVLAITGTKTANTAATSIGSATDAKGMLYVPTGGEYQSSTFAIGNNATGIGSLVIDGGTVVAVSTASNTGTIIANTAGGYGGFFLLDGSFTTRRLDLGANSNQPGSVGVAQMSGGSFYWTEYLLGRAGRWELTFNGATVERIDTLNVFDLGGGDNSIDHVGYMSVTAGTVNNAGQNLRFGRSVNSGTATLNLAGGTLTTDGILVDNTRFKEATINFSGGTLKASKTNAVFLPTGLTAAYVNGAFGAFNGGAVFDTDGFDIAVAADLIAPTGSGVSGLTLDNPGSGYIGAPYVEITGGDGKWASGYATVDLDPSSPTFGQLTGVVLTNPGVDFTGTPTVTLLGGGGTGAAISANGIAANTSGGLTKIGEGTLSLTGANTFTGVTTVNGGRLSVAPGAVQNTSGLVIGATGNAAFDLFADLAGAAWAPAANTSITLGGATTWGGLGFDLGTASDSIALSGTGALTVNTGGGVISVNDLAGFGAGTYDLVTGPNAITGGAYLFTGLMPGGYTYAFDTTTDPTVLTLVVSAAAAGDLYWTGDAFSLSWRDVGAGNSNWSTTSNGATEAGFSPGADNTAIFNSGAGAIDVTLDGATSAKGLKLTATAGGPLTISAGINNGSLTLGTDGIDIQADAPNALTIAAAVALNGVQTWNVADAGTLLTIGGILSGGEAMSDQTTPGSNISLTITGAGRVTFDSTGNTFTGDILVNGGGFVLNNVRDWGTPTVASTTSHTIILDNGARLYVTGTLNPGAPTTTSYNLLKIGDGGATIDIADGVTLQLDDPGQLYGNGTLTKTGTGILYLRSHQNHFGGVMDITEGLLQVFGGSGPFGMITAGTIIRSGAALDLRGQTVTEAEPLTVYGDGLASNPQGVIYSSTGTGTFGGPITLAADSSMGGPAAVVLNGIISGDYALTKVGAGMLTLSGANTYSGLTTISQGQLTLGATTATLGSTDAGTVVQSGAQLRIAANNFVLEENLTLSGIGLSDTGVGNGALGMQVNSGVITYNGLITLDGGATLGSYHSGTATMTVAQGITGTGDLTIRPGANNNGRSDWYLLGQSSYTGNTIFSTANVDGTATIRNGIDNALPTGSVLYMNGTAGSAANTTLTYVLGGYNQTLAGLSGANGVSGSYTYKNTVVGGSATLSTLTVNNTADYAFDGTLGGGNANENNLALVKKGAGKLTLTDANTHAGGTTIEAGTLALGESGALGSGAVRVNTGATLDVSAAPAGLIIAADNRIVAAGGTVTGDLTLQGGAFLALVLSGGSPLSLTVSGTVTLDASFGIGSLKNATGGDLDWSLIGNGNYALINTASTFDHITNFGEENAANIGDGRSAYFDNDSLHLHVIPEPASLGVLGILALAALLPRRVRR